MVSISDKPSIKYWQDLGSTIDKAKDMIPKDCRIGETCFTSLATIGGNLYTRYPKNTNHVQKGINDILSVIIILGTDVCGGKKKFNGMNMNDIGKITHVIKHSHRICVVGAVDKILYEESIWGGPRAVLYFIIHK